MGRIEQLAERFGRHIALPWQQTVAGAQRVIVIVYDKELERTLLARKSEFETATRRADHEWHEVDLAGAFAEWMAAEEYRDAYFESPDDLQMKLDSEFPAFAASRIRRVLEGPAKSPNSLVAVFGAASLYGFAHVSQVLKLVEPAIQGRLVVFFPGTYDQHNYRLLDARDGWNYLAVPITQHQTDGH